MNFKFEDFVISPADFDFFRGLRKDEKLFFLYDLLCDQSYGLGSPTDEVMFEDIELDDEDIATIDPANKDANGFLTNFEDIATQYEKVMGDKFKASLDKYNDINVIVLNNFVVINSISLGLIEKEVLSLFEAGYIVKKHTTTPRSQRIFHHMKYCMVFELMGKIPAASKN